MADNWITLEVRLCSPGVGIPPRGKSGGVQSQVGVLRGGKQGNFFPNSLGNNVSGQQVHAG